MELKPISVDLLNFPAQLRSFISGSSVFDSSCSPQARVFFIDENDGYFLKSSAKGDLEREAVMTEYFHKKGLAPEVLSYLSDDSSDWLLTTKIAGNDCIYEGYLAHPERLVDVMAEQLYLLHHTNCNDCPVQNNTQQYLSKARHNFRNDNYDKSHFPDSWGYSSAEEAIAVIESYGSQLKEDVLIHGDYCLPNVVLNDWKLSGFVDLGCAGVGDRHFDVFWAMWSLCFNLKTDKYRERFTDAYGRADISQDCLRIIAAIEVFG